MKVLRLKIKTLENNHVHFDGGNNIDTLCGLYTLGDERLGISEPVIVNQKVNCPQCIRIVKICNLIERHEYANK